MSARLSPWSGRLGSLGRLLKPSYPELSIELSTTRAVAVRVERSRGRFGVAASAIRKLPAGLVEASLVQSNLRDPVELTELLREMIAEVGKSDERVSLVIPDRAAKVTLIEMGSVPRRSAEVRDLITWKLKKTTPFRVEDGRLSYQRLPSNGTGASFLVSFAQNSVLSEYEGLVRSLGLRPGLVDLATFNVYNLYYDVISSDVGSADALVFNLTEDCFSALVIRDGRPIFYRCKGFGGAVADSKLLASEIHPTVLYYQDRLDGHGFAAVYLRAEPEIAGELGELIGGRYGTQTSLLDPARVVDLDGPELAERLELAPALGAALGR